MPSRSDLYSRWTLQMRHAAMFHAGERVGVAVSGGPDSVLLMKFLKEYSREKGLLLSVVHFNHQLRGVESIEDGKFVEALASESAVEFLYGESEVRLPKRNLEAAARQERYDFFFSLVDQKKVDKVATAHTANDQAETVLLRLLRGSGTRGLGGIYPSLEGKIFRPLLGITRAEVLAEVGRRKLTFRVDSSNLDRRFRRNKVRAELLPLLEREYNPSVIRQLNDLADRAREDEAYLEKQALQMAEPWLARQEEERKIPVNVIRQFPSAITRRLLRYMIREVKGNQLGISFGHIETLKDLCFLQSGRSVALPGGLIARREFGSLILSRPRQDQGDQSYCYPVTVPSVIAVRQIGLTFRFEIVRAGRREKAYNHAIAEFIPLKMRGGLALRNWREGDYLLHSDRSRAKKVKELFQEMKVPLPLRCTWPVLARGNEVVWVKGLPAPPDKESKDLLMISVTPELVDVPQGLQ
jgi:tRNA(Ile)-lysidine synthase